MRKPDLDPDKYPPQPSLKKVIRAVILFHLVIIGWVALLWVSDGAIIRAGTGWDSIICSMVSSLLVFFNPSLARVPLVPHAAKPPAQIFVF